LQAEKLNEDKSFSQDVIKHIDVDMISLHDYSKAIETPESSLPTLLNDLNKIVDDEIEIVYYTPQEITIFQVFKLYILFYSVEYIYILYIK